MLCVLQIMGTALESGIAGHLAARFYRKDVADDGCELLFYDVADAPRGLELSVQIKQFIDQNRGGLTYARQCPNEVKLMTLDIGILMDAPLSRTVAFDKELVATLGELGISISISAYQSKDQQP
ncbi:hypothetical protein [Bradyrhizobium neotropicale]|uniref:Uncharacterized protein n=1 Tax=Bradyrhizobium neotropicale TaxID=1497615 RepID=A0A176ZGQ5_9BRAD|nr:hypothetical protein [Bradyrhizobium neotropicale]OAF19871.1 hypothetical protein AXW67_35120 [Bradyrhizobium neotropicale]